MYVSSPPLSSYSFPFLPLVSSLFPSYSLSILRLSSFSLSRPISPFQWDSGGVTPENICNILNVFICTVWLPFENICKCKSSSTASAPLYTFRWIISRRVQASFPVALIYVIDDIVWDDSGLSIHVVHYERVTDYTKPISLCRAGCNDRMDRNEQSK